MSHDSVTLFKYQILIFLIEGGETAQNTVWLRIKE